MIRAPLAPEVHLFVCTNRRAPDDPLGSGCAAAGDAVYAALKAEVARRAAYRSAWITRTQCLGICPKRGCALAVYPRQAIYSQVDPKEAVDLLATELGDE